MKKLVISLLLLSFFQIVYSNQTTDEYFSKLSSIKNEIIDIETELNNIDISNFSGTQREKAWQKLHLTSVSIGMDLHNILMAWAVLDESLIQNNKKLTTYFLSVVAINKLSINGSINLIKTFYYSVVSPQLRFRLEKREYLWTEALNILNQFPDPIKYQNENQ